MLQINTKRRSGSLSILIKLMAFILAKAIFQEQDYLCVAENWLYDHSDLPQVPPQILAPVFKELLEERLIEEFINEPEKYFKPDTKSKLIDAIGKYLEKSNEQQELHRLSTF